MFSVPRFLKHQTQPLLSTSCFLGWQCLLVSIYSDLGASSTSKHLFMFVILGPVCHCFHIQTNPAVLLSVTFVTQTSIGRFVFLVTQVEVIILRLSLKYLLLAHVWNSVFLGLSELFSLILNLSLVLLFYIFKILVSLFNLGLQLLGLNLQILIWILKHSNLSLFLSYKLI